MSLIPSKDPERDLGRRASHAVVLSFAARGIRATSRLGAFWVAARLFRVDQVGSFSFWLAAGTLSGVLGDFGLSEHLMRAAPGLAESRRALFRSALRLRVVGGTCLALAGWLGALALGHRPDLGAAGAYLFGAAIGLADYLAASRRAIGRFGLEALESGLAAAGGLGSAAIVAALGGSFVAFELSLGIGTVVVVLGRLWRLEHENLQGVDAASIPAWELLTSSRWLWLKAVVGWSFLDATILLLGWLTNDVQVALFAGAARLVGLMTQPLIALNWVFMPALAHAAAASRRQFEEGTRRLNRIGLAAAPAGVALCALLGRLALSGFGRDYAAAEPALLLLALGFAVNSSVLNSVPLIVAGAEKLAVLASLAGLVVAGLLVSLTANSLGTGGAAAGVLAGLLLSKVLTLPLYRRERLPLGTWSSLALGGAIALWFGLIWLSSGTERFLLLICGGSASLAAVLLLLHRTRIYASGT